VGLQQDDPDPHLGSGGQDHRVEREVVRTLVMEVVEFAHCGGARVAHLGEGLAADPRETVAVEALHQRVHRLPPGPEAPGAGREELSRTAESALKGVRVGVDESRENGYPAEAVGRGWTARAR